MLQQQNPIWNNSSHWSHPLLTFMMIHGHPPRSLCVLHGPDRQVDGSVMGDTTLIFHVLMVAPISALPPGMWYCFWFRTCIGRESSSGFHLAFPTITSLHTTVQGINVGILLIAQYVYSSYAFQS